MKNKKILATTVASFVMAISLAGGFMSYKTYANVQSLKKAVAYDITSDDVSVIEDEEDASLVETELTDEELQDIVDEVVTTKYLTLVKEGTADSIAESEEMVKSAVEEALADTDTTEVDAEALAAQISLISEAEVFVDSSQYEEDVTDLQTAIDDNATTLEETTSDVAGISENVSTIYEYISNFETFQSVQEDASAALLETDAEIYEEIASVKTNLTQTIDDLEDDLSSVINQATSNTNYQISKVNELISDTTTALETESKERKADTQALQESITTLGESLVETLSNSELETNEKLTVLNNTLTESKEELTTLVNTSVTDLSADLLSEANARESADAKEADARESGDAQEASERQSADEAEVSARNSADEEIVDSLEDETTQRATADEEIQSDLEYESTVREANDETLQDQIDALKNGTKIWTGTQEEYEGLESYDDDTLYLVEY